MSAENGVCPPDMLDGQAAVDPDRGLVVDGTEMEHEPVPAVRVADLDFTAVPDHRVETRVVNARPLALGREGHHDLAAERLRLVEPPFRETDILVVEGKTPGSAKVDPAVPAQLRAGVEIRG